MNSMSGSSPPESWTRFTVVSPASTEPVRPSMRMPQGNEPTLSCSCCAAACVRKLKKAPLSTISRTCVPLMPTVATARVPTMVTGMSRPLSLQSAAQLLNGSAARPSERRARVAHVLAYSYRITGFSLIHERRTLRQARWKAEVNQTSSNSSSVRR